MLLEMHVVKAKDQRRSTLVKQGQSMPALDSSRKNSSGNLSMNSVNLLALHPLEVARQLTLVDFELLEKVEPLDFLKASKGKWSFCFCFCFVFFFLKKKLIFSCRFKQGNDSSWIDS